MKRILFYSHDTVGLGNIRRTLAIANHIAQQSDDVSILILSGSPMLHAFRISKGIDYVKLPCLDRSYADGYNVKSLGIAFNEVMRLRANLILHTALDFRPDLILVDKKPLGVGRELAPAFELLGLRGLQPKIALVLRDILDHPSQTIRVWKEQRYYDTIDTFYDRVIVLGEREVFDLPEEYKLPKHLHKKIEYCGYLERFAGQRSIGAVRQSLGNTQLPLVLVTAGSGSDGGHLIETYLNGLLALGDKPGFFSLILGGPEMPAQQREKFEALAANVPHCQMR